MALRVIEKISPQQIRHIPHIFYHWRLHEESASANLFAKLYAVQAAQKSVSEYLSRQGITHAKVTETFNVKGCLRVK